MKRRVLVFLALIALICSVPAQAATLDFLTGTSMHARLPAQFGPHYEAYPGWETKPFYQAPYYTLRLSGERYELEWLHDKMYLVNNPPGVSGFNISDGLNMFFVNRIKRYNLIEARVGVGPVIAHPEGTIDDELIGYSGGPGYRFAGWAAQASVAYRKPLSERFSLLEETKITAARPYVQYDVGPVDVPSLGVHVLLGVSMKL